MTHNSKTYNSSKLSLEVPFRFQRDKSVNFLKWNIENTSVVNQRTNSSSMNNDFEDQNENIIFPTLTSGKFRNYVFQINNNCNSCKHEVISNAKSQNTFHSLKANLHNERNYPNCSGNTLWNLNKSRGNPDNKKLEQLKKIERNYNKDSMIVMPSQFFKAEAILFKNYEEYTLPTQHILMNRRALTVSYSKPPFSTNCNGSINNCKILLNSKKMQTTQENYNAVQNEEFEVESIVSDNRDTGVAEMESVDNSLAGEMDLLDNLDSEIPNEDLCNLQNIEDLRSNSVSPTEDMLKEVHRLVNNDVVNSSSNEPKPAFINSLFSNIPPVIRFVREGESVMEIPRGYRPMLKWRYSAITPNVVKRAVKRSGFKLTNKSGVKWIGYFGSHLKSSGFRTINEHQKINHMPGSFQIGRKDRLWRNVTALSSKKSKIHEFNFLPKTYCLPADLKLLKRIWDDEESRKKAKWILKPPAAARGIGVRVISKWSQVPKKRAALIQNYISRPFLINDSKFDLRIYVAITSCDPLRIYVYREGLVRFASHKYSKSSKNISNRFIHLTNYSVNKKNSDYLNNEDHNKCQGHKWTLQTLWRHFEQDLRIDWIPIWKNIKDCIIKTIISVESHINSNIKMFCTNKNCVYELFGFDVLLDHNLKPWVLEVNVSPSLHSNSPLDIEVKSSLIADLFNLVGFQLYQPIEDPVQTTAILSRRPSLSASSIPINVSKSGITSFSTNSSPSKTLTKNFRKQLSLSSLGKTRIRKPTSKISKQNKGTENQSSISDDNDTSVPVTLDELHFENAKVLSMDQTISESFEIDSSKLQRRGYFNKPLLTNEKAKHKFYIQKMCYDNPENDNMINFDSLTVIIRLKKPTQTAVSKTVADKLTLDDAKVLIESIDEFNRLGNFELIFPVLSEDLDTYLSYINTTSGCRYYNSLLVEFMKKYKVISEKSMVNCDPALKLINSNGLKLLEKYSKIIYSDSSIDAFWVPPVCKELNLSKMCIRSNSAEVTSAIFK